MLDVNGEQTGCWLPGFLALTHRHLEAAKAAKAPSPRLSNVETSHTNHAGAIPSHASAFTHTTRLCHFLWSRPPRTAQSNSIPGPLPAFAIAAGLASLLVSHGVSLKLRRTLLLSAAC